LNNNLSLWRTIIRHGVYLCLLIGATTGLLSSGCRRLDKTYALPPIALDGARALAETEKFVALGPRVSGTAGAETAALYLWQRLRDMGIETEMDIFQDASPGGPYVFRNVLGHLPGSGTNWVILASHYDTKHGIATNFVGANDSGSSTGLLLELAQQLRTVNKLPTNILLAFLDGEECRVQYSPNDGLHGSRHLARTLVKDGRAKAVRAVIVIDMIGDRDLTLTIPRNITPALGGMAMRAATVENIRRKCRLLPTAILDDHQPFLDAGMPAVLLIDFEYGSSPGGNDYWHTSDDTLDKLSAESLQTVGRMVLHMLYEIMQMNS
jgi:glutaminyl-peptide cyclotransferase